MNILQMSYREAALQAFSFVLDFDPDFAIPPFTGQNYVAKKPRKGDAVHFQQNITIHKM